MKRWYPTSIRLSKEEMAFVKQISKAQKHGKIATYIRSLLKREMRGAA